MPTPLVVRDSSASPVGYGLPGPEPPKRFARGGTGYQQVISGPDPKTTQTDTGPDGSADVVSDPAKGADEQSDWSDEGGATPSVPATE